MRFALGIVPPYNNCMNTYKDIAGKTFGLLTATRFVEYETLKTGRRALWEFKCSCGTTVIKPSGVITRTQRWNAPQSCGCATKQSLYKSKSGGIKSRFNEIHRRYVENANSRGYEFNLTREEFEKLVVSDCFYCGGSPSKLLKSKSKYATPETQLLVNGVDRYLNSIGYTTENSVPCCWTCNRMKLNLDGDDFINRIEIILNNMKRKR